ncbi:hypothetical protein [Vampirovibrio sp.]|uniref:hypothetical protein n=1 Tax=Vampirovibrio sp. TaxID=2717857 RepID=UPI0035933714
MSSLRFPMIAIFQAFWRRISSGPRERQAMALLRIATGLFFLLEGQHRLTDPGWEAQWLGQLKAWAVSNPFPLYKAWMLKGMLPHAHQVANWVTDLKILVGVSYVSGFLVPLGAAVAIVLSVNFWLAAQHTSPEILGLSLLLTLISLVLFWGKAGQQFGLDQLFSFAGFSKPSGSGSAARRSRKTSPASSGGAGRTPSPKTGKVKATMWGGPKTVKTKPTRPRRKTGPSRVSDQENVRKFERPTERPAPKPPSANLRKLEKILKQETDKQKQSPLPEKTSPKLEKTAPPALPPKAEAAPEAAPENLKVIKIFDHRTPDDDD